LAKTLPPLSVSTADIASNETTFEIVDIAVAFNRPEAVPLYRYAGEYASRYLFRDWRRERFKPFGPYAAIAATIFVCSESAPAGAWRCSDLKPLSADSLACRGQRSGVGRMD
jgi:hypothetical protein